MTITTGSYPAALEGGSPAPEKPSRSSGKSPTSSTKPDSEGGSYDAEYMAAMEQGYNPRKAMAAGIVKC